MRTQRTRLGVEQLEPRCLLSNYFVSPNGDDGNDGSQDHPWATLQQAANSVAPGDFVDVLPGDYAGMDVSTSGTADAPIVFHAEPGVFITSPEADRGRDGINVENGADISYVTLDGFNASGMPEAGIRVVGAQGTHSVGVVVTNCVCDSNGKWGIFTAYTDNLLIQGNTASNSVLQHGIYVSNSSQAPVIRGNTVFGNNGSGIQINADASMGDSGLTLNALLEKNVVYDNGAGGGAGINLDGVQQSVIQNNLLYDNHATGIALFQGDGADASKNNVIVNNTVVVAADGRWALLIVDGSTGNTVVNNILLNRNPGRGAIDIDSASLDGFYSDYNAVTDAFTPDDGGTVLGLADWQAATGQDAHSFVATEAQLFADPANNDYHLASGSPAIGAGTSYQAPSDDLDGNARPSGNGWDVGAYEWVG